MHGIAKPKIYVASNTDNPESDISNNFLAPTTFSQAIKGPEWRPHMGEEIDALMENDTWELVKPDPSWHIILIANGYS